MCLLFVFFHVSLKPVSNQIMYRFVKNLTLNFIDSVARKEERISQNIHTTVLYASLDPSKNDFTTLYSIPKDKRILRCYTPSSTSDSLRNF